MTTRVRLNLLRFGISEVLCHHTGKDDCGPKSLSLLLGIQNGHFDLLEEGNVSLRRGTGRANDHSWVDGHIQKMLPFVIGIVNGCRVINVEVAIVIFLSLSYLF